MFRATLPNEFTLMYTTPDDEFYSLNNEEDYQALHKLHLSKSVKVFIIEKPIEIPAPETQQKDNEEVQMEEIIEGSDSHVSATSLSFEESEKHSDLEIRSEASSARSKRIDQGEDIMESIQRKLSLEESDKQSDLEIRSEPSSARSNRIDRSEHPMEDIMELIQRKCEDRLAEIPDVKPEQEVQIKNLVRETIQEQMSSIVGQVKETLLKEGFIQNRTIPNQVPVQNLPQSVPQNPQNLQNYQYPVRYYPVYQQYSLVSPSYNPYPYQQQTQPQRRPSQVHNSFAQSQEGLNNSQIFNNSQDMSIRDDGRIPIPQTQPDFIDKVMNMIVELPSKAVDFVDNLARKIEGDPVVICAEGRYPKSVVDKGNYLKEIFRDADRKELLDFVERFPKEMSLNQIAEIWIAQRQSQQLAGVQNNNTNNNNNNTQ